jgi:hypothetical protein
MEIKKRKTNRTARREKPGIIDTLPACSFQPDAPEPHKSLIQMRINEYQPTHIPATMQGCNMDNVSVTTQFVGLFE